MVGRAGITQFTTDDYQMHRYNYVSSEEELERILQDALSRDKALVAYTLISKDLLKFIRSFAKNTGLICIDAISPLIDAISDKLGIDPNYEVGATRKLDEDYFKRIEAIEFAVKYDDGKDPRGFKDADLVLIGVSRTSKTPLSMYLANKNIKVANLPLVIESPLPKEIYEISNRKIIGLTNSPEKLYSIREERLRSLGLKENSDYANMLRILEELDYAERIMRNIGCPIIDVSNKAIEETSDIIISTLAKNGIELN